MNGLKTLPRGFGAFPQLEVLDLTYNNLSENSLPVNFFCLGELPTKTFCYTLLFMGEDYSSLGILMLHSLLTHFFASFYALQCFWYTL